MWYLWVTEGGARRFMDGLQKLTQFFMNLLLCGHKTGAFKHRKSVCFLIGFCSDPHLWSWILGNDRNNIISGASGRDGVFAKSPRCGTSRQSGQLWNSQSPECGVILLRIERSQICWFDRVLRMTYKRLARQVLLAKTTKSGSEVIQDLVWVTTSPTLLFSSWCGARKTLWNWCWSWDILRPP